MTMSMDLIKKHKKMDYKYLVMVSDGSDDGKGYLVEYLGGFHRNRSLNLLDLFKTNSYEHDAKEADVYDGLMLPPDEDTKKSGFWSKIKGLYERHVKGYYSSGLIDKHAKSTCYAMLYQLRKEIVEGEATRERESSFDDMFNYLNSVYFHLSRFYNCVTTYYNLKQVI